MLCTTRNTADPGPWDILSIKDYKVSPSTKQEAKNDEIFPLGRPSFDVWETPFFQWK
jgi:hypothetical protein